MNEKKNEFDFELVVPNWSLFIFFSLKQPKFYFVLLLYLRG